METVQWDYGVFWKEALSQIRSEVTDQEWVMWFNNLDYDSSAESSPSADERTETGTAPSSP